VLTINIIIHELPGETEICISVQQTSKWSPLPSGVEPATLMLHGLKTCDN